MKQIKLSLPEDLLDELDAERGKLIPLSAYLRDIIERRNQPASAAPAPPVPAADISHRADAFRGATQKPRKR